MNEIILYIFGFIIGWVITHATIKFFEKKVGGKK